MSKPRSKTKKVLLTLFLAVILAVSGVIALAFALPLKSQSHDFEIAQFGSKAEVKKLLEKYNKYYNTTDIFSFFGRAKMAAPSYDLAEKDATSGSPDSFSKTNVQVEGIDEGDIVKTDGNYIYTIGTGNGVSIIAVNNGAMEKVATVFKPGVIFTEIYVEGDTLVTIGYYYKKGGSITMTDVSLYDISSRSAPELERSLSYSGYLTTSRLYNGEIVFILSYNFGYYQEGEDNLLPYYSDSLEGGGEKEMPLEDIWYVKGIREFSYTILGKISIANPSSATVKAYLGAGGATYVSYDNIYTTAVDYGYNYMTNGLRVVFNGGSTRTRIMKFAFADLSFKAKCDVNGYISNQYYMDEYNGYLRVATTGAGNNVFIFDGELKEVGSITDIAPGESIYSVSFKGDTGSLVTFRTVDPLFKLNLSDPTAPTISEGLKKDGVSYYLKHVEGTDYLIGLGQETQANGGFLGMEIVLFDNSGADAVIINKIVIGGNYAYSEALYDPNAILYDKDSNMFGFSAYYYENDYNIQRRDYFIFGFMEGTLTLRTTIRHDSTLDPTLTMIGSTYNENYFVNRAVRIGDYVYALSARIISSHAVADNFSMTESLGL